MSLDFHSKPSVPPILKIYPLLFHRTVLNLDTRRNFEHAKRGFEGENIFHHLLLDILPNHFIPLYSLTLSHNNTTYQFDALVFCNNKIYLFEVKNFLGEYYIQNDRWISSSSSRVISNPLSQLDRSETFLFQLVQDLGFSHEVFGQVVFVNPEFTLFHSLPNAPIVLPSQIKRFFKFHFSREAPPTKKERELAEKLASMHQEENPLEQLPKYKYEELRKGVFCLKCGQGLQRKTLYSFACVKCKRVRNVQQTILEQVKAFQILFPQKKITSPVIYDWCGEHVTIRSVRRTLGNHFLLINKGKNSYYLDKKMHP